MRKNIGFLFIIVGIIIAIYFDLFLFIKGLIDIIKYGEVIKGLIEIIIREAVAGIISFILIAFGFFLQFK